MPKKVGNNFKVFVVFDYKFKRFAPLPLGYFPISFEIMVGKEGFEPPISTVNTFSFPFVLYDPLSFVVM